MSMSLYCIFDCIFSFQVREVLHKRFAMFHSGNEFPLQYMKYPLGFSCFESTKDSHGNNFTLFTTREKKRTNQILDEVRIFNRAHPSRAVQIGDGLGLDPPIVTFSRSKKSDNSNKYEEHHIYLKIKEAREAKQSGADVPYRFWTPEIQKQLDKDEETARILADYNVQQTVMQEDPSAFSIGMGGSVRKEKRRGTASAEESVETDTAVHEVNEGEQAEKAQMAMIESVSLDEQENRQSKLAELEAEVEQLRAKEARSKERMQKYKDELAASRDEVSQVQSELKDALCKVGQVQLELKDTRRKAQSELKDAQRKASQMQSELFKAQREASQMKSELVDARREVDQVKSELKDAQRRADQMWSDLKDAWRQVDDVWRKVGQVQSELNDAWRRTSQMRTEMNDAQLEAQSELINALRKMNQMQSELNDARDEVGELTLIERARHSGDSGALE